MPPLCTHPASVWVCGPGPQGDAPYFSPPEAQGAKAGTRRWLGLSCPQGQSSGRLLPHSVVVTSSLTRPQVTWQAARPSLLSFSICLHRVPSLSGCCPERLCDPGRDPSLDLHSLHCNTGRQAQLLDCRGVPLPLHILLNYQALQVSPSALSLHRRA